MWFFFLCSYLRQLFRNLFHRQGFTYDYVFDWNMLKVLKNQPKITSWSQFSQKNYPKITFLSQFSQKIIQRSHFDLNFHSLEGVAARRQKQTRDMPENRKCDSTCPKTWGKSDIEVFFSNCYSESSDLEANLYSHWNRWKPWFAVGKLGIW